MSDVKAFLDTNLFVYLYSGSDIAKKEQVLKGINVYERFISTQVLNEFCNVCVRKLKLSVSSVDSAVKEIVSLCNLVVVDDDTVFKALRIHDKYNYSYYDSLMLASALECDCQYMLSEDMADGQVVEQKLTIVNPFKLSRGTK